MDGQKLQKASEDDVLRDTLSMYSDKPFLPLSYIVWRNYKRVFGCQMLAADVQGPLVCCPIAPLVASGEMLADEYFMHVATHFSYPSPVFEGYSLIGPATFPFCAVMKALVAKFLITKVGFLLSTKVVPLATHAPQLPENDLSNQNWAAPDSNAKFPR